MSETALATVLPTYSRVDVTLVRGDGPWVFDPYGKRYLDFVAGIAVVGLGHLHPAPLTAARSQLETLWHVSNLYWTQPMEHLAARLSARFGGASAFFCNSGTEAVEAAIKYARKASGRPGFVALNGSFHGRTVGSLSLTGQPAKRAAFAPLMPGVAFVDPEDLGALTRAIGTDTAAVVLEPVLGEGGVRPLSADFVREAQALAHANGALLILDEVQAGTGRTGTFFAWEQLGVKPDALMLAKGLANGLPIGCLLVSDEAPRGFEPGDHASTFGGNPVACAAAIAVCDELTDELLAAVRYRGEQLAAGLSALRGVTETRGRGLLLAADVDRPAADVVAACLDRGLLISTAGEQTLRLTPPLTVTAGLVDQALSTLEEVLA
jgi:acetylornithine aminotransferase/acetylornithine/N-succinyldiaminopimelate aminotransferase